MILMTFVKKMIDYKLNFNSRAARERTMLLGAVIKLQHKLVTDPVESRERSDPSRRSYIEVFDATAVVQAGGDVKFARQLGHGPSALHGPRAAKNLIALDARYDREHFDRGR